MHRIGKSLTLVRYSAEVQAARIANDEKEMNDVSNNNNNNNNNKEKKTCLECHVCIRNECYQKARSLVSNKI